LRRQCALLEKQLRRAESRIATQQRDVAAAEKEADGYKRRIGALESSTAAVRPLLRPAFRLSYVRVSSLTV
jgi:hypothetical protein